VSGTSPKHAKQIVEKEKQIADRERQLALREQNSMTTSKPPSSDGLAWQPREPGRRFEIRSARERLRSACQFGFR